MLNNGQLTIGFLLDVNFEAKREIQAKRSRGVTANERGEADLAVEGAVSSSTGPIISSCTAK